MKIILLASSLRFRMGEAFIALSQQQTSFYQSIIPPSVPGVYPVSKSKPIVLCVGDHSESPELLSGVLKRENYDLVTTKNSASGLMKAQSGIFDLYIFDVRLTDGSGIELCKEIRKFDKRTPILFYSADAQPKRFEEAMKAGAQAYLPRPTYPTVLLETVARLTKRTRRG